MKKRPAQAGLFFFPRWSLTGWTVVAETRLKTKASLRKLSKDQIAAKIAATVSWLGRWNWWMPERGRRLLRLPAVTPAAEP